MNNETLERANRLKRELIELGDLHRLMVITEYPQYEGNDITVCSARFSKETRNIIKDNMINLIEKESKN